MPRDTERRPAAMPQVKSAGPTGVPCGSKVVDAAARGAILGGLWVAANPRLDLERLVRPSTAAEAIRDAQTGVTSVFRRGTLSNVRLFMMFQGGFAGASCVTSAALAMPSDHWVCAYVGGVVGGGLLAAHTRSRLVVAVSALLSGAAAAGVRYASTRWGENVVPSSRS